MGDQILADRDLRTPGCRDRDHPRQGGCGRVQPQGPRDEAGDPGRTLRPRRDRRRRAVPPRVHAVAQRGRNTEEGERPGEGPGRGDAGDIQGEEQGGAIHDPIGAVRADLVCQARGNPRPGTVRRGPHRREDKTALDEAGQQGGQQVLLHGVLIGHR